jgi:hypothetical protein
LGNNQAGLNRLSQANLVRKNATTFPKASKRKDYSVYLMRVWINSRLALSSRIAFPGDGHERDPRQESVD